MVFLDVLSTDLQTSSPALAVLCLPPYTCRPSCVWPGCALCPVAKEASLPLSMQEAHLDKGKTVRCLRETGKKSREKNDYTAKAAERTSSGNSDLEEFSL